MLLGIDVANRKQEEEQGKDDISAEHNWASFEEKIRICRHLGIRLRKVSNPVSGPT